MIINNDVFLSTYNARSPLLSGSLKHFSRGNCFYLTLSTLGYVKHKHIFTFTLLLSILIIHSRLAKVSSVNRFETFGSINPSMK